MQFPSGMKQASLGWPSASLPLLFLFSFFFYTRTAFPLYHAVPSKPQIGAANTKGGFCTVIYLSEASFTSIGKLFANSVAKTQVCHPGLPKAAEE